MEDELRAKVDAYAKEHKLLHRGKPNRAAAVNAIAKEMLDRETGTKKPSQKK